MGKTALVISGGGCTGAYAVGCLQYMIQQKGLTFDMVCGTSTGSLISPMIVTGDLDLLVNIYTTVTTPDIFLPRSPADMIANASAFSTAPLQKLIGTMMTDARWNLLSSSNKQVVISASCLQTWQSTYFHTGSSLAVPDNTSAYQVRVKDDLMRAMLASSSDPVLTPATNIPSGSPNQYMDGGVLDFAPITTALLNGADTVYAIVLAPESPAPITNQYVSLVDLLQHTIDMFATKVGQTNVNEAKALSSGAAYIQALQQRLVQDFKIDPSVLASILATPQPGIQNPFQNIADKKLVIIRPDTTLTTNPQVFNPVFMKQMMQMGYQQAQKVLG